MNFTTNLAAVVLVTLLTFCNLYYLEAKPVVLPESFKEEVVERGMVFDPTADTGELATIAIARMPKLDKLCV